MLTSLPLKDPRPDIRACMASLLGRPGSGRVPLVEYLVDESVMKPVVTELLGRPWVPESAGREAWPAALDNVIAFWAGLGYDAVRFERGLPFAEPKVLAADPGRSDGTERAWANEHRGAISDWEDFERYAWPDVASFDFFPYEYISGHLPDGMGLFACHAGGPFEHLSWIMSYEGLCIALIEDRALVKAVSDKVGELLTAFTRHILDLPNLAAVFAGDDMGFRSSTLVSPADLREFSLPWHKKIAAMAHGRGKAYFLHSCGNLAGIMEDLIGDVGIDGKHSFEDAILPIERFQERYGAKVAALGGVDINILSAGTPGEVRGRTRRLVETCGPKGGFAVGSGNSIPSYVPAENYLAMVDEANLIRPGA